MNLEERLNELKEKAKVLGEARKDLMKQLDDNTLELMKISGAIEELTKLVENNKGDKK